MVKYYQDKFKCSENSVNCYYEFAENLYPQYTTQITESDSLTRIMQEMNGSSKGISS